MARSRKAQETPVTDTTEAAPPVETTVDPNIALLVAAGLSAEEVEAMSAEDRAAMAATLPPVEESAVTIGLDPAAPGGDQTVVAEVAVEDGQVAEVRPLEGDEAAAVLAQLTEVEGVEGPVSHACFVDSLRGLDALDGHVISAPGHLEQLDVHTEEYVGQVRRLTGGDAKLMHYVVSALAERLGV